MVRATSALVFFTAAGSGGVKALNIGTVHRHVPHTPAATRSLFSRTVRVASAITTQDRGSVDEVAIPKTTEETDLAGVVRDDGAAAAILDAATRHVEVPDFSDVLTDNEDEVSPHLAEGRATSRQATIMRDLRTMTLPLLAISLSNPLLSLIDTAAVGKVSTVQALASLAPATAVCDTGGYIFSFLSVVTLGLIANAVARGKEEASDRLLNDGLAAAFICGLGISVLMLAPTGLLLLKAFLGGKAMTASSAALIPGASEYMRVRALGFIPALMATQLQSSFLARRNVRLPLIAVGVASITNLIGDYFLVVKGGMGVAGAAWATVGAQVVALLTLWRAEHLRLAGRVRDVRGLASRRRAVNNYFARSVGPASALLGRSGIAMALAAAASSCGTVAVAAHQILYSVFALFCPMGEAISQTVMNLLPAALEEDRSKEVVNAEAETDDGVQLLGKTARSLVIAMAVVAVVLGGLDALCGMVLPMLAPTLFTSSSAVAKVLFSTAPLMALCLTVHAIASSLEGVLFATGDSKFLGAVYPINFILFVTAVKALSNSMSLNAVWMVYLGSIVLRGSQFGARLLWTNRRSAGASVEDKVDEVLSAAKATAGTKDGLAELDSLLEMAAQTSTRVVPTIPVGAYHGRDHYLHAKHA